MRRIVRNALDLPVNFGETLSASRGYLEMALHGVFGSGPITSPLIGWSVFIVLAVFGGALVAGGVVLLLLRRQSVVPLYVLIYSAAMCLTPFPGQYQRYLMPIVPLLALAAIVCLDAVASWREGPAREPATVVRLCSVPGAVLGSALLIQMLVTVAVYVRDYRPIAYVDASGEPLAYRLFFYDESQRGFDEADRLRSSARGTERRSWLRARRTGFTCARG